MSKAMLVTAAFVFISLSPAAARAQERANDSTRRDVGSFDGLSKNVRTGQTIYVTDTMARETEGRLVRLSENSVTLLVRGEEREFERSDIQQVARRGDSVGNGAAIGGQIFGAWALAVVLSDPYMREGSAASTAGAVATMIGIGAGIGALVDYAIKGKTVVYRTKSADVAAGPMIVNRGAGVRVALRF